MYVAIDVHAFADVAHVTDVCVFSYVRLSPDACACAYVPIRLYLCAGVNIGRLVDHLLPPFCKYLAKVPGWNIGSSSLSVQRKVKGKERLLIRTCEALVACFMESIPGWLARVKSLRLPACPFPWDVHPGL